VTTLLDAIRGNGDPDALVATTRELRTRLNAELQRGRDRLLEYNSCRPHLAAALCDRIAAADAEPGLPEYLERLFDTYGIETEPHSRHSQIIRPGDHMLSGDFPGLRAEGIVPQIILWALSRELRQLAAMAAAVASGQPAQAVVTRWRIWPPARKSMLAAALQRLSLTQCHTLLQHCARIDRVSKGQAAGNTWNELLQLALTLAGNQALPDTAVMEQVS